MKRRHSHDTTPGFMKHLGKNNEMPEFLIHFLTTGETIKKLTSANNFLIIKVSAKSLMNFNVKKNLIW